MKVVPFTKKKVLHNSIKWIRNNNPKPEDIDEPIAQAFADLASEQYV